MNNELIDERAVSPVGQPFRVCASKTETEVLELTKTNPNILYFSSDTNTIIFNGVMRTNPTPDLSSVLKKTDIVDNTSTNDNTKVLSAKQGKLLNDIKLNKTDVIGNLTNTDDTKALAASQGKILNDKKIDKTAIENTVNSSDVNKVLSAAMGKKLNDEKLAIGNVVNNLTTNETKKALSAAQGKKLQDEKISDAPKDGNPYMRKNGAWNAYTQIEEVYTFVADINGNKISQDAYNGLKAAVKAGKVIAIKLVDIDGRWIVSLSSLSGDTINLIVYVGDAFQTMVIKSDLSVTETHKNFILRDNTAQYEVTGDYNPAHKKYVDDSVNSVKNNVLTKTNTTVYNPTDTYHPATKKYVDDKLNGSSISIVEFDYNLVNALTNTSTTEEVNAAFANRSQLKTNSIVKLIGINDSSDGFDGSDGYRLCHKVSVNSPDSFIIEYFSDSNNNEVVEIIFGAGNVEVNRMSIAPAIPNDILKFKYIDVTNGSFLTINRRVSGNDTVEYINKIFGSIDNLSRIIMDMCENHTKYYFHSYNTKYNNIELANTYAYYNGQEYDLQFNISYYSNNGPVSKRFSILINTSDVASNWLYIEDILISDNIQRVVKRTKSEYDGISTKQNKTVYLVTDD